MPVKSEVRKHQAAVFTRYANCDTIWLDQHGSHHSSELTVKRDAVRNEVFDTSIVGNNSIQASTMSTMRCRQVLVSRSFQWQESGPAEVNECTWPTTY